VNFNPEPNSSYDAKISCVPERGWVVVQTELSGQWERPILELSILSVERQKLAGTLIMGVPPSFRVTLHPSGVKVGMPLLLQVRLVDTTDTSVRTIGEHSFIYESSSP